MTEMPDISAGKHIAKNKVAVFDLLSPTEGAKFFILKHLASSEFLWATLMSYCSEIKMYPWLKTTVAIQLEAKGRVTSYLHISATNTKA